MRTMIGRFEKGRKTEHFSDNSGRKAGPGGPGKLEP